VSNTSLQELVWDPQVPLEIRSDAARELGLTYHADRFQRLPQVREKVMQLLDEASQNAHSGIGFWVEADRLTALRYYAGVGDFPLDNASGPGCQQRWITERFLTLAQAAHISPVDVRDILLIMSGGCKDQDGRLCYGLYDC
jgi:hypothetical protein